MKRKTVKLISVLMTGILCTGLFACGNTSTSQTSDSSSTTEESESDSSEEEDEEDTSDDAQAVEVKTGDGESDSVTITIGVWSTDEEQRLGRAFDGIEDELGINVEFMFYASDSDFWDNIPAQIAAGTAPDLISCTNEHYLQYIDQGLFEPLNDYIESGVISTEGINETAMEAWTIDGDVWGIPYALNAGVFIINNTMWEEFGLGDAYPTTWDEVLEICKQVKEEHDMAALCVNIQEYHLTNYLLSYGGGWDYGNDIDSEENAEALQFIIDAYKEGYVITPTELGLSWDGAVMVQESALFSTGGSWYENTFIAEAPDIELKYTAIPTVDGRDSISTLHTISLVALKNSSHPDEVAQALQYAFADEDIFEASVELMQTIPAKEEYYDVYREQLPELSILVDLLDNAKPFAYPTQSKMFVDSLISLMQEAMMDDSSSLTGQDIVAQLAEEYGN